MEKELEKAVLAGLNADVLDFADRSNEDSLDELEALLETAGGTAVGRVLQNRASMLKHQKFMYHQAARKKWKHSWDGSCLILQIQKLW